MDRRKVRGACEQLLGRRDRNALQDQPSVLKREERLGIVPKAQDVSLEILFEEAQHDEVRVMAKSLLGKAKPLLVGAVPFDREVEHLPLFHPAAIQLRLETRRYRLFVP